MVSGKRVIASSHQTHDRYLENNLIDNIQPLATLTKITSLDLSSNPIGNIQPLAKLTLTGLSKLEKVFIFKNSIGSKKCPFKLASICIFEEEGAD
jgi:hypothetical protein